VRRACPSLRAGGSASWLVPRATAADPLTDQSNLSIPISTRLVERKRAERSRLDGGVVLSSSGARDDAERLRRLPAAPQLGDDPVAVAAVDRDRELDDLAGRAAGDALEEERRGMERHAQGLRLLLVGHGRLDRLLAADDLDP